MSWLNSGAVPMMVPLPANKHVKSLIGEVLVIVGHGCTTSKSWPPSDGVGQLMAVVMIAAPMRFCAASILSSLAARLNLIQRTASALTSAMAHLRFTGMKEATNLPFSCGNRPDGRLH